MFADMENTKIKVLNIGDKSKKLPSSKIKPKHDLFNFKEATAKRTSQLIMGNPNESMDANFQLEDLVVDVQRIDNRTRQYSFSIRKTSDIENFYGRTIYAKSVLRAVKAKLRKENWISDNEIQVHVKLGENNYKTDCYVWDAIRDAQQEQELQILKYLCFLNKEYN